MKNQARSNYELLYKLVNGERGPFYYLCVYCGDPADTRDHVPPISRVKDYRTYHLMREIYIKVPCCGRCNSLAGSSLQENFLERVEYVKDRLSRKFSRYIKEHDWTEEEIDELGPNLKSKVLENYKKRKIYLYQIEYYIGVDMVLEELN